MTFYGCTSLCCFMLVYYVVYILKYLKLLYLLYVADIKLHVLKLVLYRVKDTILQTEPVKYMIFRLLILHRHIM